MSLALYLSRVRSSDLLGSMTISRDLTANVDVSAVPKQSLCDQANSPATYQRSAVAATTRVDHKTLLELAHYFALPRSSVAADRPYLNGAACPLRCWRVPRNYYEPV